MTGYRRDIDGLRALAVVPVVLGHAGIAGFSGGFVGVDVFFVISGFLITGILMREIQDGRFSILKFYERRARRILPALYAVLTACLIAGFLMLTPDMLKGLARSAAMTLLFSSNMWFWHSTGDYFGTAAEWEPLLHTWSLAVEEQFYIVFPLLLWLLARRSQGILILVVGALSALSFALSVWATSSFPSANFFFAPTRAWELGVGALLALGIVPPAKARWHSNAAGLAGIALIVAAIVLYTSETPFPGIAALPPSLGAALIIWAGTQRPDGARAPGLAAALLSLPPFVWIGLISYSLYLWHWPVQVLYRIVGGTAHLPLSQALQSVAIATALAWISWRFVERPFRRGGEGRIGSRAIFALSGAGAVALGLSAVAIDLGDGLPERIPQDIRLAFDEATRQSPLHDECIDRRPEDGLCELGAPATGAADISVLVWGDSHAGALLPGVDAWLSQNGLRGVAAVKRACPPLPGLRRADRPVTHDCAGFNDAVLEYLEARDDIRTVLLHARWALAVEGTRAPGESGGPASFVPVSQPHASAAVSENHDRVGRALSETVARIRATGRDVIIIDGVPEIGWSVPHAVFNAAFLGAGLPPAPTRQEVDARNSRTNALLHSVAQANDARVISLVPALCAPVCKVEEQGQALYRDDDHLTPEAVRRLLPPLLDLSLI